MALHIQLVNNFGEEVQIPDLGITMAANEVRDVTGYYLPDELRHSQGFEALVLLSGAISISGSEGILSIDEAARFFAGSTMAEQIFTVAGTNLRTTPRIIAGDNISVASGVDPDDPSFTVSTGPSVTAKALVGDGAVTVTSGTDVITISGASPAEQFGNITSQYHFTRQGNVNNVWLRFAGPSVPSNEVPITIPFDSELIAVTFGNSRSSADVDLEIHRSPTASGTATDIIFTWEIRDLRVAHKSNFGSSITFGVGDKVGIFASTVGGGTTPADASLMLFFRALSTAVSGSGSEDYSGDFS